MISAFVIFLAVLTNDPVQTTVIQKLDEQNITVFDPIENDQVWKALERE